MERCFFRNRHFDSLVCPHPHARPGNAGALAVGFAKYASKL
ncbi:hypothetical protein BN2497_10785 [Janthinobacterium sp. CG23_2]|nr:hypothetical protein BN2497_10785 [Janthinobacterium sp. CG23_2]CUU31790.1 hypothetical protein BN3177_10785 [Janthinobacterium sp. CG23_2]